MSEAAIIYDKATGKPLEVRTGSPSLPEVLPNVDMATQAVVRVAPDHPAVTSPHEWKPFRKGIRERNAGGA